MAKNLVIVESPAKAKTITRFLGDDFVVASSYGHLRDLDGSKISIDVENQYTPTYVISKDKEKVVKELKKLAEDATEVYLATDEDREGEAISWHLCFILGLDPKKAKRITYTEVTEDAIKQAVNNPRNIDLNLVNAQQARRVLDRLVGYELSPVLWKKVKPKLSAGRVQSVAVRVLVDREREIMAFESQSSFKIDAEFLVGAEDGSKSVLHAFRSSRLPDFQNAREFIELCQGAEYTINKVEKKPAKRSPSAPFTTSTLQQEASRKLSFSVSKTMMVAQRLYEAGFISYMRTDSVNLSQTALSAAAETITKEFGENYVKTRQYKTKNSGAQEAHEAIRPSYMDRVEIEGGHDEQRLYDLIRKRTVASQMAEAELEKTLVDIGISTTDQTLSAKGEVIVFDGFLKVYKDTTSEEEKDEDMSGLLPPLTVGQKLELQEMLATERFTKHPPRYTEASLVKKLEELGIGRPSTYAPTISTIQKRNYVEKESREGIERAYRQVVLKADEIHEQTKTEITGAEKAKLFPTDIGMLVNDFLVENFTNILDFSFTADIEKEFDQVAAGSTDWHEMIDSFYRPFHENVETTEKEAERVTGERHLGEHPETGERIITRMGRYGPMVQLGITDEEAGKKPRYAPLRKGQSLETITLEDALPLFKLPRVLGDFEEGEVKANIGRYGPYVQHDKKFVSIPEDFDPYTISLDEAIVLIQEKRTQDAQKLIANFEEQEIQVLNGRYGPYIKQDGRNYKIPKDKDAKELSLDDCLEIIKNAPPPKKRARSKK